MESGIRKQKQNHGNGNGNGILNQISMIENYRISHYIV